MANVGPIPSSWALLEAVRERQRKRHLVKDCAAFSPSCLEAFLILRLLF